MRRLSGYTFIKIPNKYFCCYKFSEKSLINESFHGKHSGTPQFSA